ncbi:MAG: bifunctional ADP-dependent NAD(P)H-hydrate dehydratase/NAD(P)H-hydrate epimerase [Leptospiraceae bacterium]|nr:bifunctional ADP-dependent NAD(P)H-hydrate dehydratase/NAD(P)H-hydrate epimerase [Leptospiraceae bacterium]
MPGVSLPLYSFAEVQRCDQETQAAGIDATQLMGRAAQASYTLLSRSWYENSKQRPLPHEIVCLCGPGNNGGDGYALAWLLRSDPLLANIPIRVYSNGTPRTTAARHYFDLLKSIGMPIDTAERFYMEYSFSRPTWLIDALLGVGLQGRVRGFVAEIIQQINAARKTTNALYCISLDLPSGLSEDYETGPDADNSSYLVSDEIHSYGLPKLANYWPWQKWRCEHIHELAIGFHPASLPAHQFQTCQTSLEASVFKKKAWHHKYAAGAGILIGGSRGMTGAMLLAARSFFASGGGLLHAFVADSDAQGALQAQLPEVMWHPLTDLQSFPARQKQNYCIAAGMGLSDIDREEHQETILQFLRSQGSRSCACIWDAGCLHKPFLERIRQAHDSAYHLLTPHQGEWQGLGGSLPASAQKLEQAVQYCKKQLPGFDCLIKGTYSVSISADQAVQQLYINSCPGLAVAGSGDILDGILLALGSRSLYTSLPKSEFGWTELVTQALALHQQAASASLHPGASQIIGHLNSILDVPDR